MESSPPARADSPAQVEAGPEQHGEVAGKDADAGESRLVAERKRDRDPAPAGLEPVVTQQRESVYGNRHKRCQRQVLVQARAAALEVWPPEQLRGHPQPDHDRQRDQHERDDARSGAPEPPDILQRLGASHRTDSSRTRVPAIRPATRPIASTSPLSCTIRPPCSASTRRAPSGPSSSAIFDSVSASSALSPSAVAPISPVHAGDPVLGSSR